MPEPVPKLPFEQAPCLCVSAHRPTPLEIEKHHIFPQYLQRQRHGKLVDHETVPLCDIGHKNVHISLLKRLRGEDHRLGNHYLQGIVEDGLRRIREG